MSHAITPKKSLGQNFLIDEHAVRDIARSIEVNGKHIIEVGPGYGALTEHILSHNPQTLDLVELDRDMIDVLKGRFFSEPSHGFLPKKSGLSQLRTHITLHHADVLEFVPVHETYSVIANIPYYITSPILFHFLYDIPMPPSEMVIMMQQEVGEKILAKKGKKIHNSYLSLALELVCENIEALSTVPRESFFPVPKVDSLVLRFQVKHPHERVIPPGILSLWKTALSQPRKTLLSNLKQGTYDTKTFEKWIRACGYSEKVRAEAISLEDWRKIADPSGEFFDPQIPKKHHA